MINKQNNLLATMSTTVEDALETSAEDSSQILTTLEKHVVSARSQWHNKPPLGEKISCELL